MTTITHPAANGPLNDDFEFRQKYQRLLKRVFEMREIQNSLEDFNISQERILQSLQDRSDELFGDASNEYTIYEQAAKDFKQTVSAIREERQSERLQKHLYLAGASLFLVAVIGFIADPILHVWLHTLPYLTGSITISAILGAAVIGFSGIRLTEAMLLVGSPDATSAKATLTGARDRLLSSLRKAYLLPFVRTLINDARLDSLDQEFSVSRSPGLTDVYDTAYHVPTSMVKNIDRLLDGITGGSIGIAGSRGSGKSALIRRYCDPSNDPYNPTGDLRCMAAAPVDYVAREFVLYLFTIFCRAVVDRTDRRSKKDPYAGSILIWWSILRPTIGFLSTFIPTALWWTLAFSVRHNHAPIMHFFGKSHPSNNLLNILTSALFILGCLTLVFEAISIRRSAHSYTRIEQAKLRLRALDNLKRIRYLQTRAAGWSGTATLLTKVGGQYVRTSNWAEQPLTYPEVVDRFREFARDVAEHIDNEGYRVFIGIDELDKIGAAESAERFLNEIKGIFGIPYTYFIVSVSDEALTSFEKRGLPLRDVFDSCFDEIIRAEPLTYKEARRLLYRRVIGLSEPFVALCYCISGGLARDLIRSARQVVRIGKELSGETGNESDEKPSKRAVDLTQICPAIINLEVQRKARAALNTVTGPTATARAQELLHSLHELIVRPDAPEAVTPQIIYEIGTAPKNDKPEVKALRIDIAGYLYFCMTLEDIFNSKLKERHLIWATGDQKHSGHFDFLAEARATFPIDTQLAWSMISRFREEWGLTSHDPPICQSGVKLPRRVGESNPTRNDKRR